MNVLRGLGLVWLSLVLGAPLSGAMAAEKPVQPAAHAAAANKAAPTPATGKAKAKATKPSSKTARKNKARKEADAIATPVPPAKLDLSLPKTLVDKLEPPTKEAQAPVAGKTLLPEMFADKKPDTDDFQLNGRILSNEMQLPMIRNEGRRDIDGAALDFKFKQ